MKNPTQSLIAALAIALAASTAFAIEPQEIADRASATSYYQGESGRAEVLMTITDPRGRERRREMTILRKDTADDNGSQRFFVYFRAPADVSETAFLVWKNPEANDERWLYLPALDLVRRIAASDERTSFVGSHFYYEDVSGRSPNEDTHTLQSEDETYYVLRSEPKDPSSVEFDYFVSYIHKPTFLPVKTDYFKSGDRLYRTYEALAVEQINGFNTVTQSRMTDLESKGSTVLTYENVRYDLDVGADLFTEQYLRNPPSEVLR